MMSVNFMTVHGATVVEPRHRQKAILATDNIGFLRISRARNIYIERLLLAVQSPSIQE